MAGSGTSESGGMASGSISPWSSSGVSSSAGSSGQLPQHGPGAVAARHAEDAAAGVRAGAGQEEPVHRGVVAGPAGARAQQEELVEVIAPW